MMALQHGLQQALAWVTGMFHFCASPRNPVKQRQRANCPAGPCLRLPGRAEQGSPSGPYSWHVATKRNQQSQLPACDCELSAPRFTTEHCKAKATGSLDNMTEVSMIISCYPTLARGL